MKKLLTLVLVAAMLMLSVTGCGTPAASTGTPSTGAPASAPAVSADKDTLTFVSHMTSETFDPSSGSTGIDKNAMHQIFDCLLAFDSNGTVIPCLAESWEEAEDGKTVTFKLRQDVTFHDGTPFNADAVIFTFETYAANPANASMLTYVSAWEKTDDYTVVVTKGSAYAKVLNYLAEFPFIMNPVAYEADPEAYAKNPVGTGAYVFDHQGSDGYVYLTANPNYFAGEPYFKNVVLRTPMDSSTAVVALQNGEVDIAIALTPNQLPIVESDPSLKAEITTGWSLKTAIMMGGQFDGDQNLRRAVYYAINRENAAIFNNESITDPATDLFAARVMDEYKGMVDVGGYDPALAAEFLAKSNYDASQPITINVSSDLVAIAQSVQADLKAVGIETTIQQLDTNAYYAKITDGTCELTIADFGTDMTSAEDMLNFFTSMGFYGPYTQHTPEYDQLLVELGGLYTVEERAPLAKQAMEMQMEFANTVPLYESTFNFVHRADLTGFNLISGATYVYYLGNVKPA